MKKVLLPMLLGIVLGSFLIGSFALAQLETGLEYGTFTGLGTQDLRVSVMEIIRVVLGFLGVITLVIVVYGGWVWMTAAGNADRVALAKRILTNAIIGLVIVLSSFMITSFIINQLSDATGAGPGGGSCTTGTACYDCVGGTLVYNPSLSTCNPGTINQCLVVNITPSGIDKPMNSIARVKFNNSDILDPFNSIQVYDVSGGSAGTLVLTTRTFNGSTVELVPLANCPAPNAGLNCFDANSDFEIRSDDSAVTCGGFNLTCGSIAGNNCVETFSTGDSVDVAAPTISIIGTQVCQSPNTRLEALVDDDYGISFVDFFDNSAAVPLIDSDNFITVPPAEIAKVNWDTTVYNVGDVVTIDASAADYDANTTNATPYDFTIRAGHCCNAVRDADETGLNCGGNDCETCSPVIEWVDPNDGAPGNLITIHGRRLESSPGDVNFLGGGVSGVNAACGNWWSDEEVIIGVPAGAGDGPLELVRADGQSDRTDQAPGTNIADFDQNTIIRPGLCQVTPNPGPPASLVGLDGLNFFIPLDVFFGGQLSGGTPVVPDSTFIGGVTVPSLRTGDVMVRSFDITNLEFSNPINYTVNPNVNVTTFECSRSVIACDPLTDPDDALCQPGYICDTSCGCVPTIPPDPEPISCDSDPGTPICNQDPGLCPTGYDCDPNSCVCETSLASGNESSYTWFFTTTSLGPSVAETCDRTFSCELGSIASPTPFNRTGTNLSGAIVGARRDDGEVPIDLTVGATFTDTMQQSSLSDSTINVFECNIGPTFDPATCVTNISGPWASPITTANSFQYIPNGTLNPDTWYQVILTASQIYGINGVALSPNDNNNNYSWIFKTRNDATPGEVGCVYVDPAKQTSYQFNDLTDWTSRAADQDFYCVNLNPNLACSQGWGWSTGGPEAVIDSSAGNLATTRALAETLPGSPVDVLAQCNNPTGAIVGSAELEINFSSPVVIGRFPDCGTACLNSKIGATFSLPMDSTSVQNAMSLHICFDDPDCEATAANLIPFATFTPNDPAEDPNSFTATLAPGDTDGDGVDDFWLLPNNYYRVVITDIAASDIESKSLENLNYATSGSGPNDAYTWVFKTQANYGACLPHTVDVKPNSAIVSVGDAVLYSTVAKSSPDQCFGQSLDPYSFDWAWQSIDPVVADFALDDPAGLTRTLRDACGNGVIEQGEDCDDGNLNNTDGCSDICLTENDTDFGNSNYNIDICGNRVVEISEQCERPGSRGCNLDCTLSGSVPGVSLCGDGIIETGEQCDDADLLLGSLAQSGDGCSSSCLVEDPNRWFCRSNTNLRFDFNQADCSVGTCSPGYTCAQLNTALGNSNLGPVCGNGMIENGEECDFGGTCSDNGASCTSSNRFSCGDPLNATCDISSMNGCSPVCINEGSVQEGIDPPNVGPFQIVDALANGFTSVQSWIASFAPPNGPLGSGDLQVGDGGSTNDPVIIDRYPNCGTACANAGMGAVFNISMDVGTLNPSNISLYGCGADPLCDITTLNSIGGITITPYTSVNSDDSINMLLPLNYNPTDFDQDGVVDGPALLPNTYYRIVVNSRVEGGGRSLVGLNFDDPNDSTTVGLDSHSWIFKTQSSSAACTVGRVEVHPESISLPAGTLQTYFAEPWTESGSCDPLFGSGLGQRLNSYFYDWRWDTLDLDGINVADFLIPLRDGCGNSVVEYGEDCDDGNLDPNDGCGGIGSGVGLCQHEGSNYAGSTSACGNGAIEQGEDCDDGNIADGDSCSGICLWEGNINYDQPVCGNRIVEAGEQCDTGSEPNGNDSDGCTDVCTFSGAVPTTGSICGDGRVDQGESCDQGELASSSLIVSNDGCTGVTQFSGGACSGLDQATCRDLANTQWCYWAGAECLTRQCIDETVGVLGNGNWDLAVCGNGRIEYGEECDNATEPDGISTDGCTDSCLFAGSIYADSRIDPYQIVQTTAIGSPIAEANEEIRAWHNLAPSIVGVGELKVVSGGLVEFAAIGHKPPVGDPNRQCLNVEVSATFSRALDVDTIEGNIVLCEGNGCTISSPNLITDYSYRTIRGSCVNNACQFAGADNASLNFGFCSSSSDCVGSKVSVGGLDTTDGFLARNTTFNIHLDQANLLDTNGDSLTGCGIAGTECSWDFQTSDNFCSCDFVGVNINPTSGGADTVADFFTCAGDACGSNTPLDPRDDDASPPPPPPVVPGQPGNQHIYNSTCYDVNNPTGSRIALSPLGIYFTYSQLDPDDIIVDFPGFPSFDPTEIVTANPQNGDADVRIVATEHTCVTTGQLCDPTSPSACSPSEVCQGTTNSCNSTDPNACGGNPTNCISACQADLAAIQTVTVTNFICNNPWPDLANFPYIDNQSNAGGQVSPDTNFTMFYCRDAGGPSTADDLPALGTELVSLAGAPSIKDFLFPIAATGDAIGIKILPNPLHLSPATWYRTGLCDGVADFDNLCFSNADCSAPASCKLNIFDKGSFSQSTVDGYQAIREGRTVYVGATNLVSTNLYSNIYLISYNDTASASTIEIFNRILDNNQVEGVWSFNNTPEFTNHRFCQNSGYYTGTTIPCTNVGLVDTTTCGSVAAQNKTSCEANAASGCSWNSSLNACLALMCEPIICTNDFECPNLVCSADKEMVVRDAKRFGDLRDIQITLENYAVTNGVFPSLSAGSYIPSTTFSVWPSWQNTLANDLGTQLFEDPLNTFVGCPGFTCDADGSGSIELGETVVCDAAVDTTSCPPPGSCLPVDADQAQTCWDEVNLQLACPDDGYVYAYRAGGGGLEYQLYSRFEYEAAGNWRTAAPPNLYNFPLSNLAAGSCQILNLEIGAATISGGTTPSACLDKFCYGGLSTDGDDTCNFTSDCINLGYGSAARCTGDADGDGTCDFGTTDNCTPKNQIDCSDFPNFTDCFNPDQADANGDGVGDVCDPLCQDDDKDGVCDNIDNCPVVWNAPQSDVDGDGIGDSCDQCTDIDGDLYGNPGDVSCTNGPALDCSDDPALDPLAFTIHPGVTEICTDGLDNNCDGLIDSQDVVTCPIDTCSDTDAGVTDYENIGTAIGSNGGVSFSSSDFCTSLVGLTEFGCSGTTLTQSSINCEFQFGVGWTCNAGFCVAPLPPSDFCSDTDGGPADSQNLGTVSGFENGNGTPFSNTDSCNSIIDLNEWGCSGPTKVSNTIICSSIGAGWTCDSGKCVAPPPPPDSCSDTDGSSTNTAVSGTVSGFENGNGTAYSRSDSCSSGTEVLEWGCTGVNSVSTVIACSGADICSNGECVPQADSCTDTDSGSTDYQSGGDVFGFESGGTPYNDFDTCTGATTLQEWGCSSSAKISNVVDCAVEFGTGWTCSTNRCIPPADSCSDTDAGPTDYANQGTVSGFSGGSSYANTDSCSGTNLTEWSCSGTNPTSSAIDCATQFGPGFICNAGICILGSESGQCFDGQDNDADGSFDCADSDCWGEDDGTGPGAQVCCGTSNDCTTGLINIYGSNHCAAPPVCGAGNVCDSFVASNAACGIGGDACGLCDPTSLTCGPAASACTGSCSAGCSAISPNDFQCAGDQNLCAQVCSTCSGNGTGDFSCTDVNARQDCDGLASSQCCSTGVTCDISTPPLCVSCTDADSDGICDEDDWCPYDPDNDFDFDGFCAVGCTSGSNPSGSPFPNGLLCDGPPNPSVVAYDNCQGGPNQVNSGICSGGICSNGGSCPGGTNAECTNFITGSCTASNSCLVLFGADERLNVYINGTMVAGNLYLPDGFVVDGELLGGNGSNSYPDITRKIFVNVSNVAGSGQSVIALESFSDNWNLRQIRGGFVNSSEDGWCTLLKNTQKWTSDNFAPFSSFPSYCYTDDNLQNTGIRPAPQGSNNWNDPGFDPVAAGWPFVGSGGSNSGPINNLYTSSPSWMRSLLEGIWSTSYPPSGFTYSHGYCRSNIFSQP